MHYGEIYSRKSKKKSNNYIYAMLQWQITFSGPLVTLAIAKHFQEKKFKSIRILFIPKTMGHCLYS